MTSLREVADALPITEQPSLTPVFRARGLCKTYVMGEVEVRALRDVNLDIYQGEFVVLLGLSGSKPMRNRQLGRQVAGEMPVSELQISLQCRWPPRPRAAGPSTP
jgi:ABC-type taurine transport system ATPase subunit